MKKIDVTCAIILFEDKTLAVQRSETMKMPLKWEFPGGKIEKGESAEACIMREIKEELNIDIQIIKRLQSSVYNYPTFTINLIPFIAKHISGEILLHEHKAYKLLNKEALVQLDWAAADIPILKEYLILD